MSGIRIVVAGAAGRMGQALVRAVMAAVDFELTAVLEAPGRQQLGKDAGVLAGIGEIGVPITADPVEAIVNAQAVVDFTTPSASLELAALAAQARIVHVIGTTGFSSDDDKKILAASRHATIIKSGNMSVGVTLLAELAKQAARTLPDFDVEIVEMHHNKKVDAPSGTALLLGHAAAEGRGIALTENTANAEKRKSTAREPGSIGFASLRGGSVVGEHDVIFAGAQERVVLRHVAEDRSIFANGALAAARWGQGRKPGLYSIADVLGF